MSCSTVSYEVFFPEVLPYVHDVPEFVAINAIRNACIEFCDKSLYIQYTLDPITIEANVSEYSLDLPKDTVSARVVAGWVGNLPLTFKSEEDLQRIYPLDWRAMGGRPQYLTQKVPWEVIIAPYSDYQMVDGMKLIIALKPSRDSTTVDRVIFERWVEAIGFGARARLYDTPNQPYYDPTSAAKYRTYFESAIGEAKTERNRGLTRNVTRVRPPRLV